jgi:hypothetical protein
MIRLCQSIKNRRCLPCTFALLFALLSLSTTVPRAYAVTSAIPSTDAANWAGVEATAPLGTFRKSQCMTKVPKLTGSGDVSVWCGLGGDPSSIDPNNLLAGEQRAVLVQAGVDTCLDSVACDNSCRPNVQCNIAWWEIANALVEQPIQLINGLHIGDVVSVYIQSNIQNNNIDLFIIQNRTTGEKHTIIVNRHGATDNGRPFPIVGPHNGFLIATDGASVECIVERPTDASTNLLIRLATFQLVIVAGCDDEEVNRTFLEPISSIPTVVKISMYNPTNSQKNVQLGVVIAQPTNFFGRFLDDFTVVQKLHAQPQIIANSTVRFVNHIPG